MGVILATPTQSDVLDALRQFLIEVLPDGVPVGAALVNRVSEFEESEFVLMTPMRQERLETNIDSPSDLAFTASITTTIMTVTAMDSRFPDSTIIPGLTIFGPGVGPNTKIVEQVSGTPGGVGTYRVSFNKDVPLATLSASTKLVNRHTQFTIQLDFHGATLSPASDMAATVSTLFRDSYAYQSFANQGLGVVPLYADDPRLIPYVNENQQVEMRWIVEANLQTNQVVRVPVEYADAISVEVISVDATYPP